MQQWMTPSAGDPKSKQNDDVDAADVYFHVRVVSRRVDGLLAGEQLLSIAQQYWINRNDG